MKVAAHDYFLDGITTLISVIMNITNTTMYVDGEDNVE